MVFLTRLTAVLRTGSRVSCHSFVAFAFVLTKALTQEDRNFLCPRANLYLPTVKL
jgi:hypothetical protein